MSMSKMTVSDFLDMTDEEYRQYHKRMFGRSEGGSDEPIEKVARREEEEEQDVDEIGDFFEQRGKWAKKEEPKKERVVEKVKEVKQKKVVQKEKAVELKGKKVVQKEKESEKKKTLSVNEKAVEKPDTAETGDVTDSDEEPVSFEGFSPSPPRKAASSSAPLRSVDDHPISEKRQNVSKLVNETLKNPPQKPVATSDALTNPPPTASIRHAELDPKKNVESQKVQKTLQKPQKTAQDPKTVVEKQTVHTEATSPLERDIGSVTNEIVSVATRGRVEQQLTMALLKGTQTTLSAVMTAVSSASVPRLPVPPASSAPIRTLFTIINFGSRNSPDDTTTAQIVSRILELEGLHCPPSKIEMITDPVAMPRSRPPRFFRTVSFEPSVCRELTAILGRKDVVLHQTSEYPSDHIWIHQEMTYEDVLRFDILRIASEQVIADLPIPLKRSVFFNAKHLTHPHPTTRKTITLSVQDVVDAARIEVFRELNKSARFVYYGMFGKKD